MQILDVSSKVNQKLLDTHHYTCFNSIDNTCDKLYYVYRGYSTLYYIEMRGNERISDALNKMLINDDINVKDSTIKEVIDHWYEKNIKDSEYEHYLDDTIFCND